MCVGCLSVCGLVASVAVVVVDAAVTTECVCTEHICQCMCERVREVTVAAEVGWSRLRRAGAVARARGETRAMSACVYRRALGARRARCLRCVLWLRHHIHPLLWTEEGQLCVGLMLLLVVERRVARRSSGARVRSAAAFGRMSGGHVFAGRLAPVSLVVRAMSLRSLLAAA